MSSNTNVEDHVIHRHPDALCIIDDELSEDDIRSEANGDLKPTDGMVRYARVYVSAPPRATITEMAVSADISRKTVYDWRKNRHWRAWMGRVSLRAAGLAVGRVWKAVLDKAAKGDIRAAGMVLRRFDPKYRHTMLEAEGKRGRKAVPQGVADEAREALQGDSEGSPCPPA